ncbi:MAG: hypothetical protein JXA14_04235 [Anaerolineae bacterium]|nr:hypothetical protein [Anaerolineae bacterium]
MDSQILARMTALLETDSDFFVPIKKLWLILQTEGLELDLEEFQRLLQKDERFEVALGEDHKKGFEADPKFTKEMEDLGFYSGPRVKLASREMTAEDIFAGMTRSLNRMNQALQSAWEARPVEDQETEDQLLEILAAGQRLEREIQRLVDQQDQLESASES